MSGVSASLKGYNLFAYCFNDPINMTDSAGNWPKWVEKAAQSVKDFAYSIYYNATKWHFEGREERNGEHPTYQEVKVEDSGWTELPENQSIYHDNGIGNPEKKFTHTDGREAVFDGDTLEPVTDPKYIATYNYCPLYKEPESSAGVSDYIKIGVTAVGHFFADMLPYYLTGNSNTREQFESKVAIFN